jgi:hypothetical protein
MLVMTIGITRPGRKIPTYDTVEKKSVFLDIRLCTTPNTKAVSSSETLLYIHLCTVHGVMYHT